ncbi:MAG: sporulation stage IV protein A [Clostridium sp.]
MIDGGWNRPKVNPEMTEERQSKLQDALQKINNDSNGGLICIII